MKTTSKPTLPDYIKVTSHSKWYEPACKENDNRSQIKFVVEIECEGRRMTTPYSGGMMAFLDKRGEAYLLNKAKVERWLANPPLPIGRNDMETIIMKHPKDVMEVSRIDPVGVIHSLISDMDYGADSFEDFCGNGGYDEDSRKAFDIYTKCQQLGKEFKRVVGKHLDELRKITQDY